MFSAVAWVKSAPNQPHAFEAVSASRQLLKQLPGLELRMRLVLQPVGRMADRASLKQDCNNTHVNSESCVTKTGLYYFFGQALKLTSIGSCVERSIVVR
ncbi:hypothetical protein IG631_00252 [Alternaria alternata]|nr:hypothetical protein IG631_00252 [Alternaria alternata]